MAEMGECYDMADSVLCYGCKWVCYDMADREFAMIWLIVSLLWYGWLWYCYDMGVNVLPVLNDKYFGSESMILWDCHDMADSENNIISLFITILGYV